MHVYKITQAMVKLVRDFTIKGKEEEIFLNVRDKLPLAFTEEEFKVLDEIKEGNRVYRKSLLRKKDTLDMIPSIIKDNLPQDFIRTSTSLIEESIYYEKEKKIQFTIVCEYDNVYSISGSVRIVQLDPNNCKVYIILYFELNDISKYVPNEKAQSLVIPLLESKIPDVFLENIQTTYQSVC